VSQVFRGVMGATLDGSDTLKIFSLSFLVDITLRGQSSSLIG
jgi:hypothetical protein